MSAATDVLAVLASAVAVLCGIAALTRSIWKAAQEVHDNKTATQANTRALDNLKDLMETRIGQLESRVDRVESYLRTGSQRR